MITSILIDSREPQTIQKIDFGVPSIVTGLEAGDALVGCSDGQTLVVERKTTDDLLNSIRDGRLFSQCAKMREVGEWRYLVVVGRIQPGSTGNTQVIRNLVWVETGWNWDSVQGALLTVQELGVCVVRSLDYKDAILRLSKRERKDVRIRPIRGSEPVDADELFLSSLPGIGPITAQRILANGAACWMLEWLTDLENKEVYIPGIGRNQKAVIREILGLKSNEIQTVRIKDEN